MALTLLVGGARSGKSSLAVELGRRFDAGHDRPHPETEPPPATLADLVGGVVYIATATSGDDDMSERIERHRAERPDHWWTVEETHDLGTALGSVPSSCMAIIDCLTMWTTNRMLDDEPDSSIEIAARAIAAQAASRPGPTVVISNEVGLGIHPATEMGRHFRDLHGRVNQLWAAAAQTTLLLVAGRAMPLTHPVDLFGQVLGEDDASTTPPGVS
ncbi:MAG: bifunctional adenosylcobinamide kinase/adenosylcobinamide-phosphate guanylyltransferase [Actinomycetota bacterium]